MHKWLRIILGIIGLLAVTAVTGFILWGSNPLPPMPAAEAALVSDAQVTVETGRWIVFTPATDQPPTGLIFYPGGHVDPRAYAPPAHVLAEKGYLVVIVPMPLNLAVLHPGAAAEVIAGFPEIRHWVISGHSLGGSMAAKFARDHPGAVEALALWASYPAGGDDLSQTALRAASIYGTLDGLTTGEDIAASHALLPADTAWTAIQGGNHAQFGWYGDQPGDNPATISRPDQQNQIIQAMLGLLESIK